VTDIEELKGGRRLVGPAGVIKPRCVNTIDWLPGATAHIDSKRLFAGVATRPGTFAGAFVSIALVAAYIVAVAVIIGALR